MIQPRQPLFSTAALLLLMFVLEAAGAFCGAKPLAAATAAPGARQGENKAFVPPAPASASGETGEKFSGHRAYAYVEKLCQPEFAGRFTGHPGARRAAEWIGAQFANWGLAPGGDASGWLQLYPMIVTEQLARARMLLKNGAFGPVDYQEGNDFTVYINSGSARVTAEVLFAGFGISEPAMGRDDYAGLDARGKIVLIYRGLPAGEQDWEFANERDYKMRAAAAHGAIGLLMLDRGDWPIRGGTIHEEGYFPGLAACNISKKIARDLFHGTFRDLDGVLRDLPAKPNSFALGRTLRLEVQTRRIEPGTGENVVAILHGSDPVLRNEYIVLGGHMDHNGVGRDGHFYAGADDNASGTAVVMEVARVLAAMPQRPKRSLIFAGFGGEEQGLRGSKYFAYHPPVPAGRIAAMFNFDMEGAGDGGAFMGGRNYLPAAMQTMISSWSDSLFARTRFGRGWGMGGSDHAHFNEQGIPTIYFSSTGDHPWYHQFEDLPHTLNIASLQSMGDRAIALIETLANWKEPLALDGLGAGRFFLRHGDQLDWNGASLAPGAADTSSAAWDQKVLAAHDLGIHGAALPLTAPAPASLFRQLDSLDQWIARTPGHLIRYEDGGSVDRAAGQGKLAVALLLQGTTALQNSPAALRQLGRLGLNLLVISSPQDPLFANGEISAAGAALLKAGQTANLMLRSELADTALHNALAAAWPGRLIWSLDLKEAQRLRTGTAAFAASGKHLLSLHCSDEEDMAELADFALTLPADKVHLDLTAGTAEGWPDSPRLVTQFYQVLTQRVGGERSYKLMEKWLGRNLKRLLTAERRP